MPLVGLIKKTLVAVEQDREDVKKLRKQFLRKQRYLKSHTLVFLDEAGYRLGSTPRFGWAPKGHRAYGTEVLGAWSKMNILGAIATNGVRAMMATSQRTTKDVFLCFNQRAFSPKS